MEENSAAVEDALSLCVDSAAALWRGRTRDSANARRRRDQIQVECNFVETPVNADITGLRGIFLPPDDPPRSASLSQG